MHGCWEERGCSNEQRAAVDSGHCCCPRAFGCWLMGLFGMPPLLDAEWWSGECVPLCPSLLWRLKGDRYLDTVPRLNDWNGMEEALSQPKAGHLLSQGDTSWSQDGMENDTLYSFRWQWHWKSWVCVIFSYLKIQLLILWSTIVPSNPTQLKDDFKYNGDFICRHDKIRD